MEESVPVLVLLTISVVELVKSVSCDNVGPVLDATPDDVRSVVAMSEVEETARVVKGDTSEVVDRASVTVVSFIVDSDEDISVDDSMLGDVTEDEMSVDDVFMSLSVVCEGDTASEVALTKVELIESVVASVIESSVVEDGVTVFSSVLNSEEVSVDEVPVSIFDDSVLEGVTDDVISEVVLSKVKLVGSDVGGISVEVTDDVSVVRISVVASSLVEEDQDPVKVVSTEDD